MLSSLPDVLLITLYDQHWGRDTQYQERAGLIMTDLIQQVELHNLGLEEEGTGKGCNKFGIP